MLHEKRVPYDQLKSWVLDAYYEGCRDHAVNRGWMHEEVLGYVSCAFEEGFDRAIENMMWQVILLVCAVVGVQNGEQLLGLKYKANWRSPAMYRFLKIFLRKRSRCSLVLDLL